MLCVLITWMFPKPDAITAPEWCSFLGYGHLRSPQIVEQVVMAEPHVSKVFCTDQTTKETDYDRDCNCTE
jgi:hypothetical protein